MIAMLDMQILRMHAVESWLSAVDCPLTANVGCIKYQKAELTWLKMSFPCFTLRKN